MSADVSVQVRFSQEAVGLLKQLTEEAVARAVSITVSRLRELARRYTPEDTGRLLESFDIASTPRSIVMKWQAPYAEIAEKGAPPHIIEAHTPRGLIFKNRAGQWIRKQRVSHPGYTGRFYGEAMKFEAREILKEELVKELELMIAP